MPPVIAFIGVQILIPLTTALVSVVGVQVASALFIGAGLFGLSKLTSAIFGGGSSISETGQQINMAQGPAEAREYLYGKRRTGGSIALLDSTGSSNNTLWIVSVIASHEINAFTKYYIDEKEVTLSGNDVTTSPYNGFVSIYPHTGSDTEAADATLVAALTKWTTNHRLRGCAYVLWKLTWDQDVFPGGLPNLSVEAEGKKCFDPRDGGHDEADKSTWAYTTNPVLQCLDYMRDDFIGPNIPWTAFTSSQVQAAANTCDEAVETVADRYTASGIINTDMAHADVISEFELSMAGTTSFSGGVFEFHPGKWDASSLSLGEDDIISISTTPAPSRKDLVNAVKGLFIDPNQAYQPVDYPAKTDAGAETEDGGERFWLDHDLAFTLDHKTAQRIRNIMWNRHRRRITANVRCKLPALGVKAMSVVDITHTNFGWSGETFRVVEWRLALSAKDGFAIDLKLEQEDSAVYTWLESTDLVAFGVPAVTSFFLPFGTNIAIPFGSGFISLPFTGSNGITVPGLQLSYSTPTSWIQQIQAQYKLNSESAIAYRPLPNQALIGPDQIHFPAVPESWDVRLRNLSIYGTWSDWDAVSGTTVPAGAEDATKGAQLGVNVLDEAGSLSLFNKHLFNSLTTGANLWIDGAAEYSYGGPGFQGYTKGILSSGNPKVGVIDPGFIAGEKYTYSADFKHDAAAHAAGNASNIALQVTNGTPTQLLLTQLNDSGQSADVWHRLEKTFTMPSGFVNVHWGIGRTGAGSAGTIYVRNFKLEKAEVASGFSSVGQLGGYDQADTGQLVDDAVQKSIIEDLAVSEPYSDVQNPSPQTMILTQNTWDEIDGISIDANFPSGEVVDVFVLLSGSCHTKDSTGYAIDVRLLEEGVQKLLFTYAWGSNDMTTQSEGSFDFNVPLIGRFTGSGSTETFTVEVRLVAPFFAAAGGWQAPEGFRTRDSQLVMRKVAK